ncbi:dihydrofolate reductase family protein [Bacteroidales bacterium OttesenSCG-928-I14]|nr:dihydrofolate reductase family protein [Bacteroidales bacterium OttesenSCG-928-I14]
MEKQIRIKIYSFLSLDGYVLKTDSDYLLEYNHPEGEDYGFKRFLDSVECVVMNGIYYATQQACDHWPAGNKPCHIITPSYFKVAPETHADLILFHPENSSGFTDAIDSLRKKVKGDIWLAGDTDLISEFMEHGLIDEITLNVVPITIGNGNQLFNRNKHERYWTLQHHTPYSNGVIQLKYTACQTIS